MSLKMRLALCSLFLLKSPIARADQIVPDEIQQPPKLAAVGVFAAPYEYKEQGHFVKVVEDRFRFFEHAIANWSETPTDKEEVVSYANKAKAAIAPALERAKADLREAASANSKDWPVKEAQAKKALTELQNTYYSLHKYQAMPQ